MALITSDCSPGELSEETFQKNVLPFEGLSSLRWGGKSGPHHSTTWC